MQVCSFAQNASHAPVISSGPPVLELAEALLAEALLAEALLADVESAVEPPALPVDAAPPAPPAPDVACPPPTPVASELVARVVESPPSPPPVAHATTETTTKEARARVRIVPQTSQFSARASTRSCDASSASAQDSALHRDPHAPGHHHREGPEELAFRAVSSVRREPWQSGPRRVREELAYCARTSASALAEAATRAALTPGNSAYPTSDTAKKSEALQSSSMRSRGPRLPPWVCVGVRLGFRVLRRRQRSRWERRSRRLARLGWRQRLGHRRVELDRRRERHHRRKLNRDSEFRRLDGLRNRGFEHGKRRDDR